MDQIITAQRYDKGISWIKENIASGVAKCFSMDKWGAIFFENRLVVPKKQHLRQLILKEAHESPLTIHPGSTKMYQNLRQRFWWTRMKREIAQYIASCESVIVLKQSINGLLAPFNLWLFLSGNVIKSVWISLLGFPGPREGIMPSSS